MDGERDPGRKAEMDVPPSRVNNSKAPGKETASCTLYSTLRSFN